MSLMKIAHRLREHDWLAAAIELVIVIVGILIALQVSNWNQERHDRARGQDYYRRIHGDLETDIQRIATTRAYYATVSAYGSAAIANGEEGKLVDGSNWRTLLAWYQASQIIPFELEDTSFAEMRDAGDLGLIADERLRERLAGYYRTTGTSITAALLLHNPQYRVQVRGVTPSKIQEYIWARCYFQLTGVNQKLVDCPAPISEAEAGAVLATYHGTPQLLENLRYWHTWLGVSDQFIGGPVNDQAKALLAEIEKAQKR
jgi:hypothetical protein